MSVSDLKSNEINDFIVFNIDRHRSDIAKVISEKFSISRVAAVNRLRGLIERGILTASGNTKARVYSLKPLSENRVVLEIGKITEDDVWQKEIKPHLEGVHPNILEICAHGSTEMFNNVIDHSESTTARVFVRRDASTITIDITDYGVGIFNKIQKALQLSDPRQSILELTKGKLTTDKTRHTGEGIFFTSRMFDLFVIQSETLAFTRNRISNDWLLEVDGAPIHGTRIGMQIATNASQTLKEVFDTYRAEYDEFGFSKTLIPLILLKYEGEQLISRSQAKRLMARVDKFQEVMLDFKGITSIGQAFADEVFRIYRRDHQNVHVYPINMNKDVANMALRAIAENNDDELKKYLEEYLEKPIAMESI
ncbi:MAG: ATP-binding region, ATPase-like [Nitrospira sp.]|nr:ATP-binding region, ATPase-like [Nitrospira sp.]